MKPRKSWREKMLTPATPRVVDVVEPASRALPPGKALISTPRDVEREIRRVGKGRVITLTQLRERLAERANADYACPLTTGIFLRIVAEAAEEAGGGRAAPWWRVVRADGTINPKMPGGGELQAKRLAGEGVEMRAGIGGRPRRVKLQ